MQLHILLFHRIEVDRLYHFYVEPGKHQKPHTVNTFLGVEVDLTQATNSADPYVEFRPSAGRTTRILSMLDVAVVEGLSSHVAQVIQGKLRR